MSYTIKEINSANSYNMYTVVGISDPNNASVVANSWSAAFALTDILYYADKDGIQGMYILLDQAYVPGWRMPGFLFHEIAFVQEVSVCLCVCMCVPAPKAIRNNSRFT